MFQRKNDPQQRNDWENKVVEGIKNNRCDTVCLLVGISHTSDSFHLILWDGKTDGDWDTNNGANVEEITTAYKSIAITDVYINIGDNLELSENDKNSILNVFTSHENLKEKLPGEVKIIKVEEPNFYPYLENISIGSWIKIRNLYVGEIKIRFIIVTIFFYCDYHI